MVTTKLNLSMTEPSVRQIYAKQGDTGRVLDITLDQTPEDGTLRILRPDGIEVTSEAVTGGEVESGGTFESLTEADVTELTVGIEPIQDLNGYDKPWVGGAGKNRALFSNESNPNRSAIDYTTETAQRIDATRTSTGGIFIARYIANLKANTNYKAVGNASWGTGTIYVYTDELWGSGVAPNVRFNNSFSVGADGEYVIGVFVGNASIGTTYTLTDFMVIEASETDPTWQPYSNICPITGHDEVTVTRTGKNLLPITAPTQTINGVTYTVASDGSIKATGTATSTSTLVINNQFYATHDMTLSGAEGGSASTYELVVEQAGSPYTKYARNWNGDTSFSAFSGRANVYIRVYTGRTVDITVRPMIRLASETDAAYEPYQGSTYTTSLGQTVYGGTLDMVSGVLTVDRAMATISDFGTLTNYTSSGGLYYSQCSVNSVAEGVSISSMLIQKTINGGYASTTECFSNEGNRLRVYTNATTDASFRTKFADLQIVYPLATPTVINLTPQQIKTLVGTNNVWASSGDIVSIKFAYGGLLSELPSDATSIVGKCYCDVEQNGVSSMPFTLNVKKNERAT